MPRITIDAVEPFTGTSYPRPYDDRAAGREIRSVGAAAGVTDMVVSHVRLPEGAWSSQRHWHEGEDEFLVMVSGTATLVDDAGPTPLGAGDCAAFPKNDGNGHHLVGGPGGCVFVVFGVPEASPCHYPDADLHLRADGVFTHKDGTPYPATGAS